MAMSEDAAAPARHPDREGPFILPSGKSIHLRTFSVNDLITIADCDEVLHLLDKKINEIQYQLDLHTRGLHSDGSRHSPERPPVQAWEPKARKALSWTETQLSQVERRKDQLLAQERARQGQSDAVRAEFIAMAEAVLGEDKAQELWVAARNQVAQAHRPVSFGKQ